MFNLRFQLAMGMAKNPSRIGEARRDLARAYTIVRERGGSPAAMAAAVAPAPAPTVAPKAAKLAPTGTPYERRGSTRFHEP